MAMVRLAQSRMARFGVAGWVLGLASLAAAPVAFAANPVTLTTPYPAIEVAPGAKVALTLSVKTDGPGRVDLSVDNIPTGWTATIRGGGFLVNGIYSSGTDPTTVTLDVAVPEDASVGVRRITVEANSDGSTASLPVDLAVTPTAAGEVTLTTDFPELRGSADATFTFNLTFGNDTPDDLTVGAVASGPQGWTVNARLTSEEQAASTLVEAGSTTGIAVTAEAPLNVAAGVYQIGVDASAGDRSAHIDLSVEVTGRYALTLSTPDGRLSANASAGSQTDLSLLLTNSGTATVEGVTLAATAPTGWTVTFEPETVDVPANAEGVQVTAHLTPSGNAIAGDYVTTFRASSDLANDSAEMRVTIETSLLWGVVGAGLIALVLAGLWWTFRRYGRR